MKVGIRKPNVKKSIKARTTGRVKRAVKSSVNPIYGKKGAGFALDPERSVKNAVYHRTTVGVGEIIEDAIPDGKQNADAVFEEAREVPTGLYIFLIVVCVILIIMGIVLALVMPVVGILAVVGGIIGIVYARKKLKETEQ